MKKLSLLAAVLTSLALVACAPQPDVTYVYVAKNGDEAQLRKDLESCQRTYTNEYMPHNARREALTVQCMVIEKGHGFAPKE